LGRETNIEQPKLAEASFPLVAHLKKDVGGEVAQKHGFTLSMTSTDSPKIIMKYLTNTAQLITINLTK